MKRSSAPRRRTRVKAVNPKRADREWERAYGSEERVAWMQDQPSVLSGQRPCVNAHVKSGGMGRKADARWIVPLTADEHARLHAGRLGFTKWQLWAMAEAIQVRWMKHLFAQSHVTAGGAA